MKVKYISLLTSLLCFAVVCGASACKEKGGDSSIDSSIESSMDASDSVESSQLPLTIPQPTLASDYSIAWQEVEGASAYVVNVNGADLPIKNTTCYLQPFTEVGDYNIKVKALRGTEETAYSSTLHYAVYSIESPVSAQYKIVGDSTIYGGKTYSFEIVATDDTYDFSNITVYANGKRVVLNDNIGVIENVSENIVLTVEGVETLTTYQVNKSQGEGYWIDGADYAVVGKPYTFRLMMQDGFEASESVVKVNGTTIQPVDGVYTVKRVMGGLSIAVSNIVFTGNIVQEFLLQRTWTESVDISVDGYVSAHSDTLTVPASWLKKVMGDGYTHLTFKAKASEGIGYITAYSGETELRVMSITEQKDYVFRIDLTAVKDFALSLKVSNASNAELFMGEVNAYKYTETWYKSSKLAYVCEENGVIVVDTNHCGENVEVYKRNDIKVSGGVNAVLTDEAGQPIYFCVAQSSKVISTDMEYYAAVSTDETERMIGVTVLKDEGAKRPILTFEQSKAYVGAGCPFVDISVASQEKSSIEYVYGDMDIVNEHKSIYKKAQFACELVADAYKEHAFKMYSTSADVGTVIKLYFAENTFENEFFTEKAWNNINGGTKSIEDGKLSITDSWQINLSGAWLRSLFNAGYTTIEFDVKLLNLQYFQQYDTSAPTEGYFPADGNGVVHVTLDVSPTGVVFRCKTQDGTDYNDSESIGAFSVLIYNIEIK